jgi:cysteine desulfurase
MDRPHSIYLDHNATTPLHPEVKKAMTEAMEVFGNPSSFHEAGRQARELIEDSRRVIADFIGAQPEEIVFTGNGSEANNAVFNAMPSQPAARCEIITTSIEHPCVLRAAAHVAESGVSVHYLDVDETGKVYLDQLEGILSDATALVSVMTANNEIGTIQDVGRIARMCRERGVLFHTDAVQAVGKIPVNVNEIDADYLSFSAHKLYGPKGIGALYVRQGSPFQPLIRGGHQERGRRAGTENTIGIVGFAKAIEMRKAEMTEEAARLSMFKRALKTAVARVIPEATFNGHPTDSLPGTLNVSFAGTRGEAVQLALDLEGIAVSTGSACSSGSLDPSHVLMAIGLPAAQALGSIRISLGRTTTADDVERTAQALARIVARMRLAASGTTDCCCGGQCG